MADPDKKSSSLLPDDDEARASAIEERLERLRRAAGWVSETPDAEAKAAVAEAAEAGVNRSKPASGRLVLRWGDEKSELTEQHTDVGSGEACKVRVLDPSVSSRHCRISRDGDGFRVRDMNTKTGTWVNEERIPLSSALADGDELRCGEVTFSIQIVADAAPAKSAATAPKAPAQSQTVMTSVADLKKAAVPQTIMTSASALKEAASARRPTPGVQAPPAPSAPEPRAPISGGRTPRTVSGSYKFSLDAPAVPKPRAAPTSTVATCFVVYFDAEEIEREVEVPPDRPLVVGRRPSVDLRMLDQGISSNHAAFEWVDGELVVRDLGSTNGTWVDGERVDQAVLVDQDIVRLGLTPVRVRIVEELAPVDAEEEPDESVAEELEDEPDDADDADEPAAVAPDEGAASWHLVFLTDRGTISAITVNARQSCVVAGEGKNEIAAYGRGLKPEHLQFDWSSSKLEVIQARRDALIKVNGKPVAEAVLHGGDMVSAGTLFIKVVRASALKSPLAGEGQEFDYWAGLFRATHPDLELLFRDKDPATGGRSELSIWGDGTAQVDKIVDGERERYAASIEPAFLKLLFGAIVQSGFPDVIGDAQRRGGGRPELNVFCGDERATVVLNDRLATIAPPWREVRDLLRAVTSQILG